MNMREKALWFFGLSGSGKTTLANEISKRYSENNIKNISQCFVKINHRSIDLLFWDQNRIDINNTFGWLEF